MLYTPDDIDDLFASKTDNALLIKFKYMIHEINEHLGPGNAQAIWAIEASRKAFKLLETALSKENKN